MFHIQYKEKNDINSNRKSLESILDAIYALEMIINITQRLIIVIKINTA